MSVLSESRISQISRIFGISVYLASFVGQSVPYPLMLMIFTGVHLIYTTNLYLHYI